ncbi:MAG: hypothetical protein ACREA3_06060 [Nitrosotalea sp.]|jgi:hypothetical protein
MKGMNYKKFRESKDEFYITKDGRMSRIEVIQKLESFLKQKLGEGQDFFDEYQIREEK